MQIREVQASYHSPDSISSASSLLLSKIPTHSTLTKPLILKHAAFATV